MTLDIILIIIAGLCILAGIVGSIVPALPGPPLSYVGILLVHFTSLAEYSTTFLVGWAIVIIAIQILDYFVPIWGTKKFGGSKYGAWGSTIGIVAGMFFFPPFGIIIFPFVGAVIGELLNNKDFASAIKAGFGAFLGFVAGTFMKLAVCLVLLFFYIKEVYHIIVN